MATPPLVDWLGRPIDTSVLKREIAAPMLGTVRSILTGHPSEGLTPQRLAAILRGAEANDVMRYFELAEQMEEKHPQYLSVLGTRKLAVAQLQITVEPADDTSGALDQADFIRDWLARDELQDEMVDLLDAIGKARSHTEIIWDTSEGQWLPNRLEWRDPRWFHTDFIDGRTPMLWGDDGQLMPLDPFKFIVHDHKAKSGLPIRGGLARPVAWIYLFQNYTMKDWVAFAEVYGLPLRVGRYDNGETKENIRLLMQAVAQAGADAAAVIPKSMEIEFIDGGAGRGGSEDVFGGLMAYLDRMVSKLVLGQTATTDSVTGGLGSGKEHGDVRDDIKLADGRRVAATLNRQLVRPMTDLNFGPQKAYPRILIGIEETTDLAELSDALAKLVPLGLKVKQTQVRAKLSLEDPGDGDELLTPPAVAPPPDPNASGGGRPGAPGASAPEDDGDPGGDPGGPSKTGPPATDAGGAADGPGNARTAALTPLKTPYGRVFAGAAVAVEPAAGPDAIDLAVERDLEGWRELISPAADAIDALAASCSSLQELRDRLPEAIAKMKPDAFLELIARGGFAARLAGVAGVDLQTGVEGGK